MFSVRLQHPDNAQSKPGALLLVSLIYHQLLFKILKQCISGCSGRCFCRYSPSKFAYIHNSKLVKCIHSYRYSPFKEEEERSIEPIDIKQT